MDKRMGFLKPALVQLSRGPRQSLVAAAPLYQDWEKVFSAQTKVRGLALSVVAVFVSVYN